MRSFQVVSGENANAQQFTNLRADARPASFLLAQQMLGFFSMATNPANGKTWTLTINGTPVSGTFVSGTPTNPGDVKIGATAAATLANWLALLDQPQTSTATGIALSGASQTLISYLSFAVPSGGTTLYVLSNNTNLYAPLTSFSASTNATSDSFTSQTMQLYVHAGTVYVDGTRVLFTGGSTPTVTAPSSHPRIDVLAIDNTGTLAWTTGTENASPTAPTYPANKVTICELYNVVAETALYDFDDQQSGQGYIYNDVRPFLGERMNWTAFPSDFIPDGDGTRNLGSPSFEWNNIYIKTGIFLNGSSINQSITYGGTAGESISAGAAVAIANLPNDGGPKFDVGSTGSFTGTGATVAFTVGNNPNRILVVSLARAATGGAGGSNLAYNGSAFTTIQSVNSSFGTVLMAYLIAPSTGAHNLVFSGLTSGTYTYTIHSYYNVAQSSPIDTSAANSAIGGTVTQAITPTNSACLLLGLTYTLTGGTSLTGENFSNNAENNNNLYVADNGLYMPPGGYTASVTWSGGSSNVVLFAVAIKPAGTPTETVFNASAAPTQGNGRFVGYIGIALASASAGAPITVYIGGLATGLTSLSIGQQYYLGDSSGTIQTSAGTNTRKVGIALSTTELLVTNIW